MHSNLACCWVSARRQDTFSVLEAVLGCDTTLLPDRVRMAGAFANVVLHVWGER